MTASGRMKSRWRPKARLIRTIGDEIVSSPKVAMIELIKNAYDADATRVLIRLTGDDGGDVLEIADDGVGMSEKTVLDDWMVPATIAKKRETFTRRGRRVLGEKGIGRFAAATLGRSLELVTRREGEPEIAVFVDWDAFNDEAFLDEVEIEWESGLSRIFKDDGREGGYGRHGTLLRITRLNFEWMPEFEDDLRKALGRLVSPFAHIEEFRVLLEVHGRREDIEPAGILARPFYKLVSEMDSNGTCQILLDTPAGPEKSRIDLQGVECGPFRMELRVWERDVPSLKPLAESLGMTVEDARKDLDEVCGVSIYRDGFRVLPYGDQGDDWLGLDLRSRLKPGVCFANNQVVGVIEIGADSNPMLQDKSDRGGIRESRAFNQFKEVVIKIMNELELARQRYKNPAEERKPTDAAPRDPLDSFRLSGVRNTIKSAYPDDHRLQKAVEDQERRILKEAKKFRQIQVQYARLATLGGLVDRLLHEGRKPLSLLRSEAQLGGREASGWPEPYSEKAGQRFRRIDDHGGVIAYHFKRLEPLATRGRGRPRLVELEELICGAVRLYEEDIKKHGILIEIPKSRTTVTADPVEIQTVFANLFDNSIYWLQLQPPPRRIVVSTDRKPDGSVTIIFSDNGPGVEEKHRRHIFEPYYSTKPNGTGLGLAIAGLIIRDYYDGSIALVNDGPLPGATFRIVLNRRTG